jgi:CubicO group peptidase (beta-lactamase class C family)
MSLPCAAHGPAPSRDIVCHQGIRGALLCALTTLAVFVGGVTGPAAPAAPHRLAPAWPGEHWPTNAPEAVGLSPAKLAELATRVGGRGCVVRQGFLVFSWGNANQSGDVASAFKPVLSTLLLMAVQDGLLASADDRLSAVEPRLRELNNGKDSEITWRHLASQLSGYGLTERPGEAYSYNDYALTLYYDTLMNRVFQQPPDEVLQQRLAGPLQFEDRATFFAFGTQDRPGRLAMSCRDFARIGLLYLRQGQWRGRSLVRGDLIQQALNSPIAANTPLSKGNRAAMLPGQRTLGGKFNITPVGPGYYSFNWWLNGTNAEGQRLLVDAPSDVRIASGHGGKRVLYLVPSDELIVCWNDSVVDDHDQSPGNPGTKMNQAARLIRDMVTARPGPIAAATPAAATQAIEQPRMALTNTPAATRTSTVLGIAGTQFTINGQPKFLLGVSYYGALGAPGLFVDADLEDAALHGFNWIRVWANWRAFAANAAAVDGEGRPVGDGLAKLKRLMSECDRRGMIVDISLSRGNGVTGPSRLQTLEAHQRAVETLVTELQPWRNWYLDLSNERNIRDARYASFEDLTALRRRVRALDPARLVTASQGGDISREETRRYVEAGVDFLTPHRPRSAETPGTTEAATRQLLAWAKTAGREMPVHHQEPFRRGYQRGWNPTPADFMADLKAARDGGAAGWCFHNGDERNNGDGQPRRSFDLRTKRLFEQLDSGERKFLEALKASDK